MNRRRHRAPMPTMGAVRAPRPRLLRGARQEQHDAFAPRYPLNRAKQGPALGRRGGIMAKDNARLFGESRDAGQQGVPLPLIGHQPKARQRCRPG